MGNKLYVGNLPLSVNDQMLEAAFEPFGVVVVAKVMRDRETGRSKGFGFVELETSEQAQEAIEALDGALFQGKALMVNEAVPRQNVEDAQTNRRRIGSTRKTPGWGGGTSGSGKGLQPDEPDISIPPLVFSVQLGSASDQDIGELFHELSVLYQMVGGSGLYFSTVGGRKAKGLA